MVVGGGGRVLRGASAWQCGVEMVGDDVRSDRRLRQGGGAGEVHGGGGLGGVMSSGGG